MRMASFRLILLTFVAPMALATSAIAQEAEPTPRAPAIAPGRLPDEVVRPAIVIPMAAIGAPAVAPIPIEWAPSPRDDQGRTAYGLYLAGRNAISSGEAATGAGLLAQVQSLVPEQPSVREQAFTAALLAGDLNVAARIAPDETGLSPAIVEAGELVSAVQTFAEGDARAANAALAQRPVRQPHARAGALVAPWIAAQARDWERALAAPPTPADPITTLLARYNRALLLENRRRYDDAEVEFQALIADPGPRRCSAVAMANIWNGAVGVTRPWSSTTPRSPPVWATVQRGGVVRGLRRVHGPQGPGFPRRCGPGAARRRRSGVGRESERVRGGLSAAGAEHPPQRGAPVASGPDPVAGATGSGIARGAGKHRHRRRQPVCRRPHPDRPEPVARGRGRNRGQAALTEFRKAQAAVPTDPAAAYLTAAQLFTLKREQEALDILNGPVLNTAEQAPDIRLMRGAAYEELGRIPEAEAELWAALQARPDDPTFLNYLGYLWVDSGTRVSEGAEMIARAHAADPEDGNIQDSLGWSQYRQGQYAVAVDTLEEAVAKEPANAEINDHLGDAYWQVGRQREAQFQWARVLTLDPDAERRSEVEKKIADGLTPPEPVGGTAP